MFSIEAFPGQKKCNITCCCVFSKEQYEHFIGRVTDESRKTVTIRQPRRFHPRERLPHHGRRELKHTFTVTRSKNKHTVLLVEDNISLLNSLSKNLSGTYNVFGFVTAEQALDFLQKEEVDIVISDIMLPGISGKEFCTHIKTNIITSHIPVILLTAIQHDDLKLQSLEIGADDYLTKPFSYKELMFRIQNILKRQAQLHDMYKRDALPEEEEERRMNKFDSKLLDQINERVQENLANSKYSVEELSSDVSISRVHLYRKMKNMLGVSPSRYMRDFRLKKAAEILARRYPHFRPGGTGRL